MTSELAERQIGRAAGLVMAGFILSNLAGLLQRILVSRTFGTGAQIDSFYAALRVPDLLFNLVAGGALASAFVPTFTASLTRGDRAGAWRLASSILTLVALALAGLSLLASWAAPSLIGRVLAPGFDAGSAALAVGLLRILLWTSVLFGISGLLMGILQAHQSFLLPALAPTLYWLGWVAGVTVFAPRFGIRGLAWGVVLGAGLHLAVQVPGLLRHGARLRPSLRWSEPGVRGVLGLMGPRLIGVGVVQINFLVNTILATSQPEGSLTAIQLAFAVMTMPQVVIAQSLAIAALPTFSAQAARGEWQSLRTSLTATLRGVVYLSLPASLGLILLRRPIVALLFERGAFTAHSTDLVAWALLWYAAGLLGHGLVEILSRAFYALNDTRSPVQVGAAAMTLNVILSLTLAQYFTGRGLPPHGALALANSLATTLESAALVIWIRRKIPGWDWTGFGRGLAATAAAGAAMAAGLLVWEAAVAARPVAIQVFGGVAVGVAVFWLTSLVLRIPEARLLPARLLGRGG